MSNQIKIIMRKLLLFVFVMSFVVSGFSQAYKRNLDAKVMTRNDHSVFDKLAKQKEQVSSNVSPYKPVNYSTKGTAAVDKYYIGSSENAFTLLVEQQTCLTADDATSTIMFTHRADPTAGIGVINGDIVSSLSWDDGMTWKPNVVVSNGEPNRYPSGVIFNPNGAQTNPMDVYTAFAGPTWEGSLGNSEWVKNFYASAKMDSSDFKVEYIYNPTGEFPLIRYGMSACDDGTVHIMGPNYDYNATTQYRTWRNCLVANGVWNAGTSKFDWNVVAMSSDNDFVTDPSSGDMVGSYNMIWNKAGDMGWIYFTGRDARQDQFGYQPIAYYSTDQGNTWTLKPWFDFSQAQGFYDFMWTLRADTTMIVPTFNYWNDGVVDANGELHMFLLGQGKYSIHPDSLNYSYVYEPYFLCDVYTTPTGWDARLIDTIWSERVPADQSGFGTGDDAQGWEHRILGSRTEDGSKVFVSWSDTDTNFSDMNKFPDIKAWGVDVNSGAETGVTNFTAGTIFAANNFFQYVSDVTLKRGSKYFIGVTTADLGATPSDPVGHYFLGGVELEFPCAVSANFTYSPDPVIVNDPVQFTDASTGNPTTWDWDFGDGNTSSIQNPAHTFTSTGTYHVSLTAGIGTCDDTYEMDIPVVVGIDEINDNISVDIFPNPAQDMMNITSFETIENVKIFSAFGRIVAEKKVGDRKTKINTSDLTPGMYFVQINTEIGFTTRKINIVE